MLEVGQKAPDFKLQNQDGKWVSLSQFLGKKVIIYFYPKNHTPGCTRQACAFRDAYDGFKNLDVEVIGISKDQTSSHVKFIEDYQLPFLLLSDPHLEAITAYQVWVDKNNYGKITKGVKRSTYIIDEQGLIEKVFEKANPDTNANDILSYLQS